MGFHRHARRLVRRPRTMGFHRHARRLVRRQRTMGFHRHARGLVRRPRTMGFHRHARRQVRRPRTMGFHRHARRLVRRPRTMGFHRHARRQVRHLRTMGFHRHARRLELLRILLTARLTMVACLASWALRIVEVLKSVPCKIRLRCLSRVASYVLSDSNIRPGTLNLWLAEKMASLIFDDLISP